MEDFSKENKYLRAKERVEHLRKFYNNLTSYILVISFLAIINYWSNQWSYMWFLWAAFGWGIGLIFQAAKAYQWSPFMGKNWEERKLKEFMEEEDKQQWR